MILAIIILGALAGTIAAFRAVTFNDNARATSKKIFIATENVTLVVLSVALGVGLGVIAFLLALKAVTTFVAIFLSLALIVVCIIGAIVALGLAGRSFRFAGRRARKS